MGRFVDTVYATVVSLQSNCDEYVGHHFLVLSFVLLFLKLFCCCSTRKILKKLQTESR